MERTETPLPVPASRDEKGVGGQARMRVSLADRSVGSGAPAGIPLRYAVSWLGGSFVTFLVVGQVDRVANIAQLCVAVAAFGLALTAGYILEQRRHPWPRMQKPSPAEGLKISKLRLLVALSAVHYLSYGIVYMREYGVAAPQTIMQALLDPGSAYFTKFAVFARQESLGAVNIGGQVLTILAVLATPLVPFLVVYWRRIGADLRALAFLGLGVYMVFFLAIGTLAGLGSTAIFAGASLLVVQARSRKSGRGRRRGVLVAGSVLAIAFLSYMSYNQGARLSETGQTGDVRFAANPLVEKVTNREFAQGLAVTAFYPTHGYQGLAYNLQTPFEWTHGLGASRALDSYTAQYGLADSVSTDTYPARTEARTGWPAGQYWATIYPWLASDLSWFGVPVFMFLVGWWTSRWWREAVVDNDPLALLLFAQAALFIAFIPANNQIGLSRPNLIAALTLLALYLLRQTDRALRREPNSRAHAAVGRGRP